MRIDQTRRQYADNVLVMTGSGQVILNDRDDLFISQDLDAPKWLPAGCTHGFDCDGVRVTVPSSAFRT